MFDLKISRNPQFCPDNISKFGRFCPNTEPTRTVCLCWIVGICHFMTHNSHNSKKIWSAKGPQACPNMDLTSMCWWASLSEPGRLALAGPQLLGPKCPKFVRFSVNHIWAGPGVRSLHVSCRGMIGDFRGTAWPCIVFLIKSTCFNHAAGMLTSAKIWHSFSR